MSEYQYYEFRAIDRPLTQKQMDELRALSTRAEITPTSFTNVYHWGDFKGDPSALMARYFDAFVYVANWGTNQLMFRIPSRVIDAGQLDLYCTGEVLSMKRGKGHVVLDFTSQDDSDDDWTEGEEWMPSLIAIRDELMRGDLRALYLGWLASLSVDDADDEVMEPPVPPGLDRLSPSLKSLVEFLRVDPDLLKAAATASHGTVSTGASSADVEKWVRSLPVRDKDAYLLKLLDDEGSAALRAELMTRFRDATVPRSKKPTVATGTRTVAELLAAREAILGRKAKKTSKKPAPAVQSVVGWGREETDARGRYLDELAGREADAWREVESLIARGRSSDYDRAVAVIVDLRDLAVRLRRAEEATRRIQDLRRRYSNRLALIRRLNERDLGTG